MPNNNPGLFIFGFCFQKRGCERKSRCSNLERQNEICARRLLFVFTSSFIIIGCEIYFPPSNWAGKKIPVQKSGQKYICIYLRLSSGRPERIL